MFFNSFQPRKFENKPLYEKEDDYDLIKGMLFAFLAAFSWGAAIVMSKRSEEAGSRRVFFWQICSAVILSWIVLFIKKKTPIKLKSDTCLCDRRF
ncbi:EamA family transporter [Escherichia coli]|uniref:EamA family transporter n=1 Tax=Escherichia coli TaxID=562 RepID=UPI003AB4B1D0